MAADATGLTVAQKKLIRDSWKYVEEDYKGCGMHLFLKFFEKYPAYKDYFADFKGQSLADLKDSYHLRAHATTVMYNLSSMINQLDDIPCLARMLKKQGVNHHNNGVGIEQYNHLGPVLLETLSYKLGDKFTPATKEAWVILYGTVTALTGEGMKSASE